MNYCVLEDLEAIIELNGCTETEIAEELGVERMTLFRWLKGITDIPETRIEQIYDFVFSRNFQLNSLKAQLYKEEYENGDCKVLFHGSKSGINGAIYIELTRNNNDFGRGFYCGESISQSAMFVAGYPESSLYMVKVDTDGLDICEYDVSLEWMLAISYFRGTIREYAGHPLVKKIVNKVQAADCIIAPIADNKMFEFIEEFTNGMITDVQCQHCLSATNLGKQYVFRTKKAVHNIQLLQKCYLPKVEKKYYVEERQKLFNESMNKVKLARRTYRGKGLYIDEVFE